jgi:hypothetical protein
VQLGGALYFSARGYTPSARAHTIIEGAGVAWAVAVWIVALIELRKVSAPTETAT